jgi:hypothetical protein
VEQQNPDGFSSHSRNQSSFHRPPRPRVERSTDTQPSGGLLQTIAIMRFVEVVSAVGVEGAGPVAWAAATPTDGMRSQQRARARQSPAEGRSRRANPHVEGEPANTLTGGCSARERSLSRRAPAVASRARAYIDAVALGGACVSDERGSR